MRIRFLTPVFCLSLLIVSFISFAKPYQLQVLTDKLDTPWAVATTFNDIAAENAFFITERSGSLRYFKDGELSEPVKGVPDVFFAGQGGLLDVQLHPNYSDNHILFLSLVSGDLSANFLEVYSAVWNAKANKLENVKSIFKVSPGKDTPVHFGARITVLPDNTLMLTSGDGFDYRESAQLKTSQLGKMLRFNFDGSVPKDNPFSVINNSANDSVAKYIWSIGHRNPQALFYDQQSGLVFSHEHGPDGGDEINIIKKGLNYGWPVITNGKDYSGANISPFKIYPGMEQPDFDWTPSIAPSDMILYRGKQFPELKDHLLVTTLKSKEVQVLSYSDNKITKVQSILTEADERFRAIEQDQAGNIFLLTDSGKLLQLSK